MRLTVDLDLGRTRCLETAERLFGDEAPEFFGLAWRRGRARPQSAKGYLGLWNDYRRKAQNGDQKCAEKWWSVRAAAGLVEDDLLPF